MQVRKNLIDNKEGVTILDDFAVFMDEVSCFIHYYFMNHPLDSKKKLQNDLINVFYFPRM